MRLLAVLNDCSSTPARAKRLAPRPDGPLTHKMQARTVDMPKTASQALCHRHNELLDEHGFDAFVEGLCEAWANAEDLHYRSFPAVRD